MESLLNVNDETFDRLQKTLLDQNLSIPERFRTIFTLKAIHSDRAVLTLCKALTKDEKSNLLKHEVAYCLGQMGLTAALPTLESVLSDDTEHDMVRHEAGEALGAIGSSTSLPVLEKYAKDPIDAVRETCEIAIDRIKWSMNHEASNKNEKTFSSELYLSVDPAPPCAPASVEVLKKKYLDPSLSLFERYRALFALREMGSEASVLAIAEGLLDSSALFRHEVAYVLGQIQHPAAVPGLIEVLKKEKEHEMVRHEAAEALGSIASDHGVEMLKKFLAAESQIVKESVYVALDIADYTTSDQFQYANALNSEQPPFKSAQEKKH